MKDKLLDETAPDTQDTPEERTEKLDGLMDNLQTRFARLLAEFTNTNRKLAERVLHLEKKLNRYHQLAEYISSTSGGKSLGASFDLSSMGPSFDSPDVLDDAPYEEQLVPSTSGEPVITVTRAIDDVR